MSTHAFSERLGLLRQQLEQLTLDALITADVAHLRWLTGWQGVFDDEAAHLGLIGRRKAYLHTDGRYIEACYSAQQRQRTAWQISAKPEPHAHAALRCLRRQRGMDMRVGYESSLRLAPFKALQAAFRGNGIKLVEASDLVAGLRAIKDAGELKLLTRAQALTDAAFAQALDWLAPGMTELEVASRLEFCLRQKGAEGLSFPSIVASGPNAARPHARPTKRRLKAGDLLVLDFGARFGDYCADMTRTVAIGRASEKQRALHAAVLAAHEAAKAGLCIGMTGREAHELAVAPLEKAGLAQYFTHSLGHGVGVEVHELPTLSPRNELPLQAGNVVTVEPGVYLPGFGGVRIEDFGVLTQKGFKSLARSSRELIEIAVPE